MSETSENYQAGAQEGAVLTERQQAITGTWPCFTRCTQSGMVSRLHLRMCWPYKTAGQSNH
jgi:hypothetical protein